jgi:hypothetical protein
MVTRTGTLASERPLPRRSRIRIGAVVAIALLVGIASWLYIRHGSPTTSTPPTPRAGAVRVSPAALMAFASSLTGPVYWAGLRSPSTYELTRTADGRVFLRYLPPGVPIGADTGYLTIGTYPLAHAYTITRALAHRGGAVMVKMRGGAVAFYNVGSPTNLYVAYPGSSYQIEVYDPSAAEARALVSSRQVVAVPSAGAMQRAPAQAVTPATLKVIAASLGHPVYWVGARPETTYELSRSPGDRVFVRYLPLGVKVGSNQPFLTVGTYRLAHAFAITKALSQKTGSVRVVTRDGSVAFYTTASPTNVYVAYPTSDVQIEVYDPSPGVARDLIVSKSLAPVG